MIVLPIAAGAVAVVGGALYVRHLVRRQDHWRIALSERIPVHSAYWREQNRGTGEIRYVAIGDSAAQGIGASRPAHSYVGLIAAHLKSRITGVPVWVSNFSVSGATLRTALDVELPKLAKTKPDILTVSIGANDMATFEPARFESELRELFAALPGHAIVADLPSFYFLPAEKKVRIANVILRRLAAEHRFTVVDLHSRTNRQGAWGVVTQFAGDLFHPNDRGYRIWASAFLPAIDRRIDELEKHPGRRE